MSLLQIQIGLFYERHKLYQAFGNFNENQMQSLYAGTKSRLMFPSGQRAANFCRQHPQFLVEKKGIA